MDDLMVASWDDLRLEECGDHLDAIVQWGDYLTRRDGLVDHFIPTRVQAARFVAALTQVDIAVQPLFFLEERENVY